MSLTDPDADAEGVIDDEIDDDGEHESDEADPRPYVSAPGPVRLNIPVSRNADGQHRRRRRY